MASTLGNLGAAFGRTTLVQRVILLAMVLGMIGAGYMLVSWARQPKLTLLAANVSPEDASKIVDKIRDSGTAYELKGGGTQIYVDESKVYALRLEMAKQGITPSNDRGGYRLLDEAKIGESPSSSEMRNKRALEGELAKTICLMDGVAGAKVMIARGEASLFAGKENESSASVMLTLRNGTSLSQDEVSSIVNLVSGAVPGLKSDRVLVSDNSGRPLTSPADKGPLAKGGTFLEYKSSVDEFYARKAQEMLISALGAGKSSVKVDAIIAESAITETTETPSNPVEKETIKKKKSTGSSTQPSSDNDDVIETVYASGKTIKTRSELPGIVRSKSVSVLVDLTAPANKDGSAGKSIMTVKEVEDLVRSAIGITPTDTIKVISVPFASVQASAVEPAAEAEPMFTKDFLLELAKKSSLGLMAIGAVIAFRILGGGGKKSKAAAAAMATAGAGAPRLTAGAGGGMLPAMATGEMDSQLLRAQISQALQSNPDEVKRLFLSWVQNEESA